MSPSRTFPKNVATIAASLSNSSLSSNVESLQLDEAIKLAIKLASDHRDIAGHALADGLKSALATMLEPEYRYYEMGEISTDVALDLFGSFRFDPAPDLQIYLARGYDRPFQAFGDTEFDRLRLDDLGRLAASSLEPKLLAQLARFAEQRGLILGAAYYEYIRDVASRFVVVAWAICDPALQASGTVIARDHLDPDMAVQSRRLLEPFTQSVHLYIDAPGSPIDEVDEVFVRAELGKIRHEHDKLDGIDPVDVQRSISKIVGRLLRTAIVGSQAEVFLKSLDPHPPEVVAQIVDAVSEAMNQVASNWGDLDLSVQDRGIVLATTNDKAIEGAELLSSDPGLVEKMKERFVLKLTDQAAVGVSLGSAVVIGIVSVELKKMGAVDAIWFELFRALPNLVQTYTHPSDLLKKLRL